MAQQVLDGGYISLIATNGMDPTTIAALAVSGLVVSTGLAVKPDSSNPGQFVLAAAVTDPIIGVLLDDQVYAGQAATIAMRNKQGTMYVQLGGTVAQFAALTVDAHGRLVTATGGNTSQIVAYADFEGGTIGAFIEVTPAGRAGYLA